MTVTGRCFRCDQAGSASCYRQVKDKIHKRKVKGMGCNKDCLRCKKEYCTNVYRETSRYCHRSEAQKQYQRDYQKRRREEAKANGLCIVCRKKPRRYGSKCYECYIRQKRHDRAKYDGSRERWKEAGKCYFCGNDVIPGKKVCARHYEVCVRNIKNCNDHPNTIKARREARNELQILWSGNKKCASVQTHKTVIVL